MSGFFSTLSALAFIAMIVFIVRARRKRPGSGKRAWQMAGATVILSLLGTITQTGAERQAAEATRQAEVQQQARDEAQRVADRQAAEKQRAADQAARDRAEVERKANTSIEAGDMLSYCKDQIRERLKLPDTARFPGMMETADKPPVIGPSGAIWRAWVESENSFGGTVRSRFTCIYQKKDNTISIDFQES